MSAISQAGVADSGSSPLDTLISVLPELPPTLRYYDEFDDEVRSMPNFKDTSSIELWTYGIRRSLDFGGLRYSHCMLLKHLAVQILGDDFQPTTAYWTLNGSTYLTEKQVASLITSGPFSVAEVWKEIRAQQHPAGAYGFAKCLLKFLCRSNAFEWNHEYLDYVSSRLPLPAGDAYAGVRSGDAFLSVDEEAALVGHIDATATAIRKHGNPARNFDALSDAAMVLCCLQFGMRPVQIASVKRRDVRMIDATGDGDISCHINFHVAKQRGNRRTLTVVRRVKHEWVCIFDALMNHAALASPGETDRFFGVRSSPEVTRRVSRLVSMLIGAQASATDLRHTAAQRLVDAGASHEELAEFMCHSELHTGLVYFKTAASHAELVNRALGASAVYRQVVKIAHARFISSEELEGLKEAQQIGAVPHGIPIAGIGGCESGQPACPSNPVLSCYGCFKFMPIRESSIHQEAIEAMRSVVLFFVESSRGDEKSPTYLQLRQTIDQMQMVIDEIEGASHE